MSNTGACLVLTRFISVQLQIEEISRKLRTGDLTIAATEERFENIVSMLDYDGTVGWNEPHDRYQYAVWYSYL